MRIKAKKYLSLILAVVMLFTLLPLPAVAAEEATPVFNVGSETVTLAGAEATVTVPVEISGNVGFDSLELRVSIPEGWSIKNDDKRNPGIADKYGTAKDRVYSIVYEEYDGEWYLRDSCFFIGNPAFTADYGKMAITCVTPWPMTALSAG